MIRKLQAIVIPTARILRKRIMIFRSSLEEKQLELSEEIMDRMVRRIFYQMKIMMIIK